MLNKCVSLVGLGRQIIRSDNRRKKMLDGAFDGDREANRKKETGLGSPISLAMKSKDIYVRIVHAGGRQELYQNAVPVSQLMEKYPGMSVARPEVFKNPHDSLLCPEDNLLPGKKYYVVPSTTVQKLKHKLSKDITTVEETIGAEDDRDEWDWKIAMDDACQEGGSMAEGTRCAKDFYASEERWLRLSLRKGIRSRRKPFTVPPFPNAKVPLRGLGWEPSLGAVPELSP